jgi:Ca-activated chloride channel family protein
MACCSTGRAGLLLRSVVACGWVAGLLPALGWAASPRELIEDGNAHYAGGRFAEALARYEQAAEDAPAQFAAELLHNRAAALFKLGRRDDARELWTWVRDRGDATLAARAAYNLGNCHYAEALEALQAAAGQPGVQGQVDAGAVLDSLDAAIERYREAVELDGELVDARANLELAHALREDLRAQLSQEPDQSDSEGDQDGDPDEDEQGEQQEQQQQQQDGDQEQEQDSQGQQDEQQAPQEQDERQEQGQEQDQGQDEEQQAGQEQQEEGADQQPGEDGQPQEPEQSEAAEGAEKDARPVPQVHMTPQEAERLLQLIRDAEKARREMLRERERRSQPPVERDW